jgi:hypothetical protein
MYTLRRVKRTLLLSGMTAIVLIVNCHPTKIIECSRLKTPITIDGNSADWGGLINHDPDEPFGIGIANDDKYLYLCLVSEDRRILRQVMRYGLTVWLEGKTPKNSRLGIRYPMGMAVSGGSDRQLREAQGDSESIREKTEESFDAIEVIGPGKPDSLPMKLTVAESSFDLKLKAVPSFERFTYELRIPLHADSTAPFAVPPPEQSMIKIVLESDEPAEEQGSYEGAGESEGGGNAGGEFANGGGGFGSHGGGGGGGGHGGGGHGGGGHHGGMGSGGGRHGGNHEPPEPFTLKLSVKITDTGVEK